MWPWVKGCDVIVNGYFWPMFGKDALAKRLVFNKCDGLVAANYALSGVTKSANSAESVKESESHSPCRFASLA
jgi:hypothetical protein